MGQVCVVRRSGRSLLAMRGIAAQLDQARNSIKTVAKIPYPKAPCPGGTPGING